jgi:hypothetical protein
VNQFDFESQLLKGQQAELELDQYFARFYEIDRHATREEQRKGIDRVFHGSTGSFFVEYKTDFKAHQTGNAFIETLSVDRANISGWAHSCKSDFLAYYIPGLKLIYWLDVPAIKTRILLWQAKYRKAFAQNNNYKTGGVLVPLFELDAIALQVINL